MKILYLLTARKVLKNLSDKDAKLLCFWLEKARIDDFNKAQKDIHRIKL
jgi:hypothetical protein